MLFDEVELQQTGTLLEPVPGERFYGHPGNSLYDPPILKLHGSLNWLTHTSRRVFLEYPESYETRSNPKNGLVVLKRGFPWVRPDFNPPDDGFNKWILEPVIVTPMLYKDLEGDRLIGQLGVAPDASFPSAAGWWSVGTLSLPPISQSENCS